MAFRMSLCKLILGAILSGWIALAQTTTQVRLRPEFSQISPGSTVTVAVELSMAPGWHTYWRSPGDAGQATKVVWTLPEGFAAAPLEWPVPERIVEDTLVVFAYHDTVRLLSTLSVAEGIPAGSYELTAKVSWLECEKSCIKGSTTLPLKISVGPLKIDGEGSLVVKEARTQLPKPFPGGVKLQWDNPPDSGDLRAATLLFPHDGGDWDICLDRVPEGQWAASADSRREGSEVVFRPVFTRFEAAWPSKAGGLLVRKLPGGGRVGYSFGAEIAAGAPKPSDGLSSGASATVVPEVAGSSSFGGMLVAAFLGGLVLNIMPCVLPVIALKILGFVGQASQQPGRVRLMGLVYGAGVLASFLALAALVIGVKSAGGTASWGMQFQNPKFLLVTTALVLLVALNLFGIFEVILPGAAMQSASDLAGKEGIGGAFFNGILATLLATPCTAPFLGVSLGYALSQSAGTILLFFLTAGAGLAFPYVLLCWQPAWLRFLPKPGNWMVTFKVAMGFPVLATGLWLFTLTMPHYGADKAFWVAMFLVAVALGAWVFGTFVQHARKSTFAGWLALLAVTATAYGWFLEGELDWRHPPARGQAKSLHTGPVAWAAWSPDAVATLRRQGRPVLVDFTADWCTTCQINKRRAIEVEPVVKRIEELKFASLIGDFTFEDPAIAVELRRFRRAGVPLVLVYPADPSLDPIVLPDGILSQADMLSALERATGPRR
jgi:thiol:disulfide interchange protein